MSYIPKIVLVFLFLVSFCSSYAIYQSIPDTGPWAFQITGTAVGTVTYAATNDPRCAATCKRGQFCKILYGVASCTPYCGDGIVAIGQDTYKTCDDGNQVSTDGCNKCQVTAGWFCGNRLDSSAPQPYPPIPGAQSVCSKACPDGQLDPELGEQCDDGNTLLGDGCTNVCKKVASWQCTSVARQTSTCNPICGDGKRVGDQTLAGRCDDGNKDSADGCSYPGCVVEKHYACLGTPTICTYSCGSGVWNKLAQQVCDNGQRILDPQGLPVEDGCYEQGDKTDVQNNCVPQSGWKCVNNLATGNGYPTNCTSICGDGIVTPAEACDDGNLLNGDGCNSVCKPQIGWNCSSQNKAKSVCTQFCGDGRRVGKQALPRGCDDANDDITDGCVGCLTQRLYTCTNAQVGTPSVCSNLCGNGQFNLIVGEECDNGETVDINNQRVVDGCDAECRIQTGWKCSVTTLYGSSNCYLACGDGVVDPDQGEECDDGPSGSATCTSACILVQ